MTIVPCCATSKNVASMLLSSAEESGHRSATFATNATYLRIFRAITLRATDSTHGTENLLSKLREGASRTTPQAQAQ
jgi:hypothetical protein